MIGHPDAGATTLVHDVQELDTASRLMIPSELHLDTTPPTTLPPWILDAIDRAFDRGAEVDGWGRRERPQRKEEA